MSLHDQFGNIQSNMYSDVVLLVLVLKLNTVWYCCCTQGIPYKPSEWENTGRRKQQRERDVARMQRAIRVA